MVNRKGCYLPSRLVRFLFDFCYQPSSDGAALIQNLPVDSTSLKASLHNEWLLAPLMSAIADLMLHESESNYIYHFKSQCSTAKTEQDYTACLLPLEYGKILLIDNKIMKNMSKLSQLARRHYPLQAISGVRDICRVRADLAA